MAKPTDLTLEDLFGPEAEINASKLKAERKALEFIPEAITSFILRQECQACGSIFEAPKFAGNSIFIRGASGKSHSYRPHYGGFDHLPKETLISETIITHCHLCISHRPQATGQERLTPIECATRQFYQEALAPPKERDINSLINPTSPGAIKLRQEILGEEVAGFFLEELERRLQ